MSPAPDNMSLRPPGHSQVGEGRGFSFGENWAEFVEEHFDRGRVEISKRHILQFLDLPDLRGKSFVDIGCGSGLSSLAALQAGAERVVSFDVDPRCVETAERLRRADGREANWTILRGSVLDRDFLAGLEPADIVYSWGVLHHTGRMWEAIRNAAQLLKPGALFYIALYVTTPRSPYWIEVKKRYNRASPAGKRLMELRYILREIVIRKLVRLENPISYIRGYRERRGMEFFTDVRDWLGGYPYEDARMEEVLRFCNRELGLNLINLAPGEGLAEYLFHKAAGG